MTQVPSEPRRAIILLSGGLDSAVTLALARERGYACVGLTFDYGQRHRAELAAARALAGAMGVQQRVLQLDLRAVGGSALTDAGIEVPKRAGSDAGARADEGKAPGGIPATYVPARNLIFLSCAAAVAEVSGAGAVFIGVNAVDYSGYPDCRDEFIRAFERAAALGTRAGVEGGQPPRVEAPLVRLSKAQIVREGARLGVPMGLTHSCYDPVRGAGADGGWMHCGRCDSCEIRARGFAEAGVPDPTLYAA